MRLPRFLRKTQMPDPEDTEPAESNPEDSAPKSKKSRRSKGGHVPMKQVVQGMGQGYVCGREDPTKGKKAKKNGKT